MAQTLSKEEKIKLLDSFNDRSADTTKLPEKILEKTKAEIYLYEDKVRSLNNQPMGSTEMIKHGIAQEKVFVFESQLQY
jgi:hypothetical protein